MAEALLGKVLVRRRGGQFVLGRIVETEAYVTGDPASHAFRGPNTRNRAMFGAPGSLYVFRIHQVHCANAVTVRGEAVLLRAAEAISDAPVSMSGPGRLARAFGIELTESGKSLVRSDLRILDAPPPEEPTARLPRVGISRAKEVLYRFALVGNRSVSRPRPPPAPPAGRGFTTSASPRRSRATSP